MPTSKVERFKPNFLLQIGGSPTRCANETARERRFFLEDARPKEQGEGGLRVCITSAGRVWSRYNVLHPKSAHTHTLRSTRSVIRRTQSWSQMRPAWSGLPCMRKLWVCAKFAWIDVVRCRLALALTLALSYILALLGRQSVDLIASMFCY